MTLHEEALELRKKIMETAPAAYKEELKGKPWEIALLCAEAYFKSVREVGIKPESEPKIPKRQLVFPSNKVDIMQFLSEYLWYEKVCQRNVSAEIFLNRYGLTLLELQDLAAILGYELRYCAPMQYWVLARKKDTPIHPQTIQEIASHYAQFSDIVDTANRYSVSADIVYFVAVKARLIEAPCYIGNEDLFLGIVGMLLDEYDYTIPLDTFWRRNTDAYRVLYNRTYSDTEFVYIPTKRYGEREKICIHPSNPILIPNAAIEALQTHRYRIPNYYLRFGIRNSLRETIAIKPLSITMETVAMKSKYSGDYSKVPSWFFIVEDKETGELMTTQSLWEG